MDTKKTLLLFSLCPLCLCGESSYFFLAIAFCTAVPRSAGVGATSIPAFFSAAILSLAEPLPPEMIAPAWPIRRPGGAVWPAMNAATGLVTFLAMYSAARSSAVPPISPIIRIASVPRVVLEQLQQVDLVRADDRVAADADARRLPKPEGRELEHRLVGQRARAADDADRPRLVDVAGHDADLALAGRDDAGAVRADQPHAGLVVEEPLDAGHVEDGDALGDGDDDLDAGVGRLHDRVGRAGRRDEHHAGVRPRSCDRLGHGVEDREALLDRATLARRDAADDLRAVLAALVGVERAGLADPLADDAVFRSTRMLMDRGR